MQYSEVKKDIFTNNVDYAFCLCISEDGAFNEGVSIEFANKFPNTTRFVRQMNLIKGGSYLLAMNDDKTQRALFLVLKSHSWQKPTLKTFQSAVSSMRYQALTTGIKKIVMPKLGKPIDGLDWKECRKILLDTFDDTDVELLVCST